MKTESQQYAAAMIAGNVNKCVELEAKHGLYGYPPELVCVGLDAIDEGKDAHRAIDEYLNDPE